MVVGVCMGVCMVGAMRDRGEHGRGACMAGGVHGRRHMWRGACVAMGGGGSRGVCVAGEMAPAASGTQPIGMHSCYDLLSLLRLQTAKA